MENHKCLRRIVERLAPTFNYISTNDFVSKKTSSFTTNKVLFPLGFGLSCFFNFFLRSKLLVTLEDSALGANEGEAILVLSCFFLDDCCPVELPGPVCPNVNVIVETTKSSIEVLHQMRKVLNQISNQLKIHIKVLSEKPPTEVKSKQENYQSKLARDMHNFHHGGGTEVNDYGGNNHGNGNFTQKRYNGVRNFYSHAKSYRHISYDDYACYDRHNAKYAYYEHSLMML
ncbi:hypothetical protein M9H77_03014 [Catharanthus roseus]|uniref:Uncharacterized protein n=1 Tax=Catharanthus roseus TaxID=4058 RepID=A0ACC0CA22_CATRO|nr:hypothetical protein M9H77_03014 [Catharanthus roseus]